MCLVLPENWAALRLFLVCRGQMELGLGVGGAVWRAARSVNVDRELGWLAGIPPAEHGDVVEKFRVIEMELLRLLNRELSEKSA